MEKLFDDTLFVQKERPTKITSQQDQQMFLELAKECIENGYSGDDEQTIAEDLKELSMNDSGFEMAKDLDDEGSASYEMIGDFIDWLDGISYKRSSILKENVKLWVKAHKPQPLYEKGVKLKIVESLSYTPSLRKDCLVYVTGMNTEEAYYTISEDENKKGGYVLPYEKVEQNCIIVESLIDNH